MHAEKNVTGRNLIKDFFGRKIAVSQEITTRLIRIIDTIIFITPLVFFSMDKTEIVYSYRTIVFHQITTL
ncbi:hypothetical protein HV461_10330 [Bacillus sporothermodurans]|uniref:hypothetical protein n=1 Tax=Heyndrickxia sporothermodurans TaxID=46224 RepID=UPI0013664B05|nr:hypothetical protein [Heyndrickxia sporothermodurans]MBL5771539.1 hypothetical protein [Heyndrickxia sporothermodurans]MBL5811045.1 hypothetical protein [Heyndrickxia sporothermodurans]MBL5866708.1 hypothetical protein [Heyndrickxia sporothermodurans]MED3653632.1 hypothetical protein [Heyndrickxia sporothermodurans]